MAYESMSRDFNEKPGPNGEGPGLGGCLFVLVLVGLILVGTRSCSREQVENPAPEQGKVETVEKP